MLILDGNLSDLTDEFESVSTLIKVQLPLPQWDPFPTTILYLRLVVQRWLLAGKPFQHKVHPLKNGYFDVIVAGGGLLREERWSCRGAGRKLRRQWQRTWTIRSRVIRSRTIRSRVNLGGKCETSGWSLAQLGVNLADEVKSPCELFLAHFATVTTQCQSYLLHIFKPDSVYSTLNTLIGYGKFSLCLSKELLQKCILVSVNLDSKYHFIEG